MFTSKGVSGASLLADAQVLRSRADTLCARAATADLALPAAVTQNLPRECALRGALNANAPQGAADATLTVFSFLTTVERATAACVCSAWRQLCHAQELWRTVDVRLGEASVPRSGFLRLAERIAHGEQRVEKLVLRGFIELYEPFEEVHKSK